MEEGLVTSFCWSGYGVADEVEIAHTVVGDRIEYELTRQKRLPKKGRLLKVITPSSDRVEPLCAHAQTCGGCAWQQMSYEAQLKEKQTRVQKAFQKEPDPILPSASIFGYRNKMEFTFSQNRAGARYFGLMIAQAEPYVFDLSECHLCPPWFAEAVKGVRKFWEASALKAYHPQTNVGSLRYLTLREAFHTKQKMAILNVSGNPEFALSRTEVQAFVASLQELFGEEISLFLRIHQTQKGKPTQFFEMHLAGKDHIIEELHLKRGKFSFKISPSSFFQPNTLAAEQLYDTALDMLKEASIVYDLYSGTGTLGMVAARNAKKVISIELSKEAVLDGEENAIGNQISNIEFYQGDVGATLKSLLREEKIPRPDAVIVDPPRAGLDREALFHLKELGPKQILYISCNPRTQAENVEELCRVGFYLERLQPLDQFPHTPHIENIALLAR